MKEKSVIEQVNHALFKTFSFPRFCNKGKVICVQGKGLNYITSSSLAQKNMHYWTIFGAVCFSSHFNRMFRHFSDIMKQALIWVALVFNMNLMNLNRKKQFQCSKSAYTFKCTCFNPRFGQIIED